jgi:hypothetical protein
MNCAFVYAFVPIEPLDDILRHRAMQKARKNTSRLDTRCALRIRQSANPISTPKNSARLTLSYPARYAACGTMTDLIVLDPPFELDDDANTPLTADEREELIPSYITLRRELNEAEQINIGEALRLVAIHPFPNGNGCFSRLVGDLLAEQLGQPSFMGTEKLGRRR